MQSWIPAQGSGRFVVRALPIVVAVMIQAQFALSFENSLTVLPTEPGSTLDAYVPAQDFDSQKTIIDFVDSEILLGRKAPQFRAPKQLAPKQLAPKTVSTQPSSIKALPAKNLAAQRSILKLPRANETSSKVKLPETKSPFRKWVKPKTSSTAETKAVQKVVPKPVLVAPQIATQKVAPPKAAKPKVANPKVTSPKVARLSGKPLLLNPAKKSTPIVRRRSLADTSAIVSDRSTRSESKRYESERKAPKAKTQAELVPAPVQARQLPALTTSQANLRRKIRQVLTHYYNRPMNTRDRSPWELIHAMLAFEAHSKVLQGGPDGKPITAVGWICYNRECKRRTLMYFDDDNRLQARVGPALQGHQGQLLAMLAQSRISENYPMLVEDRKLKIADLIEMEKRTCYPRTELTFKLIGLMHYLDSDATWVNDRGMNWNIPRLISEELRQPIRGVACGGTHRLGGLTLAYKTREKRGEPLDGQYLKAKKFVARYQQYAYRLQNRDGSFSTEWFRGPGNEDDVDRKLKTTGHILEWLLYASTEKELKHWKTTKAVNYLVNIMQQNRYKDWEAGPLGHAIHALLVYDRLVFGAYDEKPGESILAGKVPTGRSTPRETSGQTTKQTTRQSSRRSSKRKR